jgi:hypothetical protein
MTATVSRKDLLERTPEEFRNDIRDRIQISACHGYMGVYPKNSPGRTYIKGQAPC